MNQRWTFHLLTFTFDILRSKSPSYLFESLSYLSEVNPSNTHNTRSGQNVLAIPRHRTASFENCFAYLAAFHYNLVPNRIKRLDKSRLRNELFNYVKSNF